MRSGRGGRRITASNEGRNGSNRYDAFISYSHAVDGRLAPALQRGLQRFAKPWYRARALRIFRDETSLAATPELWSSIEAALDSSKNFILLASPEAAASHWVGKEVRHWLQLDDRPSGKAGNGRKARFLIALTAGDVIWDDERRDYDWNQTTAVPGALRGCFNQEPRYIDLRWAREESDLSLSHPTFRDAIAEFAAPLHGVAKEEIAGEEVRQHRRTVLLVRLVVAGLAALTALAAAASVVALLQRNAAVERERESRSRELASEALLNLDTEPELSVLLGREAVERLPTREAVNALRRSLAALDLRWTARGGLPMTQAVYSPSGSRVAVVGESGFARLLDAATGRVVATLRGHQRNVAVSSAEFSSDNKRLLTYAQDGTVREWDAERGQLLRVIHDDPDHSGRLDTAHFDHSGGRIATASFLGGTVNVWNSETGKHLWTLKISKRAIVDDVAFSPDDGLLAGATQDGFVQVWNLRKGTSTLLRGPRTYIWTVVFAPHSPVLVTAGDNGVASIWNARSSEHLADVGPTAGEPALARAVFSPGGNTLATGGTDGTVRLWSRDGKRLAELQGHTDRINDVSFSRDGAYIASASNDGTARIWEVATGRALSELRGHRGAVESVSFSPDGSQVVTASRDGTVRAWDTGASLPSGTFTPADAGGKVSEIAVTGAGSVAAITGRGRVSLWDAARRDVLATAMTPRGDIGGKLATSAGSRSLVALNGGRVATFWRAPGRPRRFVDSPGTSRPPPWFTAAALSFDGQKAALGDVDGHVMVVRPRDTHQLTSFRVAERGSLEMLAFDRRADLVAVATSAPAAFARVYDAATGRPVTPKLSHRGGKAEGLAVDDVEFSPDGKTLLSAGDDGTVRIWNARTGSALKVLRAHESAPPRFFEGVRARYSPDGRLIATSAYWDDVARVWDAETGEKIQELRGHAGGIRSVDWSPDGQFIVSVSFDGTVRIWQQDTARSLLTLRTREFANTTSDSGLVAARFLHGDEHDVVALGADGLVRTYACEVCGSAAELLELARTRVSRELTPRERRTYISG